MFNKPTFALLLVLLGSMSCASLSTEAYSLSVTKADLFFEGALIGIQVNSSNPSPCVQSYPKVSSSYKTMVDTFQVINVNTVFNLLNNFNSFINQFVASYDLCNYSEIATMYFSGLQNALLNFIIYFFGNLSFIMPAIKNFSQFLANNDYYNAGIQFGMILRYSTGISL